MRAWFDLPSNASIKRKVSALKWKDPGALIYLDEGMEINVPVPERE